MFEDLEELTALEILELGDGGTYTLQPISWKLGKYKIFTTRRPDGKVIQVLRVWVPKEEKQVGPNYWDITSQTLIAQILPYLEVAGYGTRRFTITKHGMGPTARFTLEVS